MSYLILHYLRTLKFSFKRSKVGNYYDNIEQVYEILHLNRHESILGWFSTLCGCT